MFDRLIFLATLLWVFLYVPLSIGDLEPIFDHCCRLGIVWGQTQPSCSGYPAPIAGVAAGDQSICHSTIEICCIRTHRTKNCNNGKDVAKQGRQCTVLPVVGGEAHKDCCEGCKMGLISAGLQMPCAFTNFAFGTPWDESHYDCCIQNNIINDNSDNSQEGTGGDEDECALYPGTLCAHKCVNTPDGYHCECFPGFKLHSNGKACVQDLQGNRCETNNPCQQECIDTGFAIQCSCYPGYELLADQRSCGDINECALGTHTCKNTEFCHNTIGEFQCLDKIGNVPNRTLLQCPPGYHIRAETQTCDDIDECTLGIDNCNKATEICTNSLGSYACIPFSSKQCPPGFKTNPSGVGCIDVDECEEGLNNCAPDVEVCHNTHGGYQCDLRSVSKCPAGFKWNDAVSQCEDVDECGENIHGCEEEGETCKNTVGAYKCDLKCKAGFTFEEVTGKCSDINECDEHAFLCKPHELCMNTQGSFHCMPQIISKCPPGFKPEPGAGSQESCIDVDECEEGLHSCIPETEVCVNIMGSYTCDTALQLKKECQSGYTFSEKDKVCVDIDECSEGLHNCSGTDKCFNINGTYICVPQSTTNRPNRQCSLGYRFSRRTNKCEDIDECSEVKPCITDQEVCVNNPGSYRCQLKCAPGYRYSTTHHNCVDVDECAEAKGSCNNDKEKCVNTQGGYRCDRKEPCLPGFKLDKDRIACIDVDECAEGSHTCNLHTHKCVNIPSSFHCEPKETECRYGYRKNLTTDQCEDLNECAIGTHDCNLDTHYCVNSPGSFQCQTKHNEPCGAGYRTQIVGYGNTHQCYDIDECVDTKCMPNEYCENTFGSYRCVCNKGFTMDLATKICKDINECQFRLHNCLESQRCDNTIGSFTCVRIVSCGTGYTLNAETGECEDDNECRIGTHNCGPGFICRNTEGSFRCDRITCPPRQKLLSDGTCQTVSCPRGMEASADGNCIDINECNTAEICRQNQRCINTIGSYRCQNLLTCSTGYELNEYGNQCVDIDECARGLQQCGANQICRNRPGGYLCECPAGHTMNSQRECVDVDECVRFRGQVCSVNSECQNTVGSYVCNCKAGFRQEEDGRNCVDIDECSETPNLCHQKCFNVWGTYQCSCEQGYKLEADNRSCKDIDECAVWEGRRKLCTGFCVNEPGSYSCNCPDGYRLSQDKRHCHDINECEEQNACRGENEVCLNTRGGYKCNSIVCPPNYIRDPDHRNRCKKATQDCRQGDTECLKEPLSYSFNYITLVSNMQIPFSGQLDLFTMRGPRLTFTSVQFNLDLKSARAPEGIVPVTREYFHLRRTAFNEAMISIVKVIPGPQDIELELMMKMYHNGLFGGSAVAKIFIFVTRYEY